MGRGSLKSLFLSTSRNLKEVEIMAKPDMGTVAQVAMQMKKLGYSHKAIKNVITLYMT